MSQVKNNNKNTMYWVVGMGVLAVVYMIWVMFTRHSATIQGWTPPASSTIAADTDWVFNFINWWSYAFFIGVVGVMGWLLFKFWRKSDAERTEKVKDSMAFEMFWVVFPTILCIVVFVLGAKNYSAHRVAPPNVMEIQANASQWAWEFVYPDGRTSNDLYIPVDQPVRMVITSVDVLHSFYIPNFRVKMDAIPGRYTQLWFEAKQATDTTWIDLDKVENVKQEGNGAYTITDKGKTRRYVQPHRLFCTEYCGRAHSGMDRKVYVLSRDQWDQTLDKINTVKVEAASGKKVHVQKCAACHSVDGSAMQGPTWKGLWGKSESTSAGAVTVDENYIRESILNPTAKIVTGYPGNMPAFPNLREEEIQSLFLYLKELK